VTRAEIEGPGAAPKAADSSDRAAEVSQLFREHNRALVLFLASRLKDIQAAREVAQEAYVRVLELENLGAVGWALSDDQVARLDAVSHREAPYPYFPYFRQDGFARLNPPAFPARVGRQAETKVCAS